MKIAVSGNLWGDEFRIIEVVHQAIDARRMAIMSAAGQLDCGIRQVLSMLPTSKLHPRTHAALDTAELLVADELKYMGPEAASEAHRAAEIVARVEKEVGRDVEYVTIDRTIPCE